MKEDNYSGKFIVLEGLDGSGSSTQAELLAGWLKKQEGRKEKNVQLTQEPTDSLIGGSIRSQLRGDWKTTPECLQLLFCADRAHHLHKQIRPWLEEGIIVISDRYFFSTVAYGSAEIQNYEWLKELNSRFLLPDLTILVEVSPEECLERIENSRPHFELYEKKKILTKVSDFYQKLAEEYNNVVTVDGERTKDEIAREIQNVVSLKLNL